VPVFSVLDSIVHCCCFAEGHENGTSQVVIGAKDSEGDTEYFDSQGIVEPFTKRAVLSRNIKTSILGYRGFLVFIVLSRIAHQKCLIPWFRSSFSASDRLLTSLFKMLQACPSRYNQEHDHEVRCTHKNFTVFRFRCLRASDLPFSRFLILWDPRQLSVFKSSRFGRVDDPRALAWLNGSKCSFQSVIWHVLTKSVPIHANAAWQRYVLVIVTSTFRAQHLSFALQPIDAKVTYLEDMVFNTWIYIS